MSEIIPITRPSTNQPVPVKQENRFPTEVINLPSKGWFYSIDNPLSSGTLELKMMTAKEEDILTSQNLVQKNIVLDKLLESVIIDKSIKPDEMFICDRNAAFFAIRRLAYGDVYDAVLTCGRCGKENNVSIDLGKMDNKPFDFEKYPKGENSFTYTIPSSGITLTYKILNKKDENAIAAELAGFAKITKDFTREVTTRLTHIITSIDGSQDRNQIRKFVNDLLSRDSLPFRKHIRETMPDIDSSFDFSCNYCGVEKKEETPMGVSFFGLTDNYQINLHSLLFDLCHKIDWMTLYEMPVQYRNFAVGKAIKAQEKEKSMNDAASGKTEAVPQRVVKGGPSINPR